MENSHFCSNKKYRFFILGKIVYEGTKKTCMFMFSFGLSNLTSENLELVNLTKCNDGLYSLCPSTCNTCKSSSSTGLEKKHIIDYM